MIDSRFFSRGSAQVNGAPASLQMDQPKRKPHILLYILIGVPLVLFAAWVAILFAYPPLPPMGLLDNAKQMLLDAKKSGALRYSERTYRSAETLMQEGWMELARQNGNLAPFRDYHRADSLLLVAHATARDARDQTREVIANLRDLVTMERNDLQKELDNWLAAMNGSLAKRRLKQYWTSADMAFETSGELAEAGEFEEARKSIIHGRSWLTRLGSALDDYDDGYAAGIKLWRRWVNEALEESRAKGIYAVIVDKSAHKTYLINSGRLVHTYNCDIGYGSAHQKMFSGDGATPEGRYRVTVAKHRSSRFYKALLINYPNESDWARFKENKAKGVISQRARVGGLIEIHGHGGRAEDWTEGCVALTNKEMDHIMQFIGVGSPVTIVRKSDQWP